MRRSNRTKTRRRQRCTRRSVAINSTLARRPNNTNKKGVRHSQYTYPTKRNGTRTSRRRGANHRATYVSRRRLPYTHLALRLNHTLTSRHRPFNVDFRASVPPIPGIISTTTYPNARNSLPTTQYISTPIQPTNDSILRGEPRGISPNVPF